MSDSSIPGFHKLSVPERVRAVRDKGFLSPEHSRAMLNAEHVLSLTGADARIESVRKVR